MRSGQHTCKSRNRYASALNEVLLGHRFLLKNNGYLNSLIGFGVFARAIYSPGSGIAAAYISLSFNNYLMCAFGATDLGMHVNIQYLPVEGYLHEVHEIMIKLGFIIAI